MEILIIKKLQLFKSKFNKFMFAIQNVNLIGCVV